MPISAVYVDVDPNGGPLTVAIDRSAASTATRSWNIQVDQIPCSSTTRAPTGCLQYFTETSGTVMSFNFQNTITTGTPQIANTNYGVCIEMAAGYCGIIWERDTTVGDNGFTVSGNAAVLAPGLIGTPDASATGTADCTEDYIIIPGGVDDAGNLADRYCGLGFPNMVTSTQKPFTMFVVTNDNEDADAAGTIGTNSGFSLNYRQTTTC
ncbi:hypothetical protein SK128_015791 [Halocaridina rubra]|uniref:CUB domain-containing protein n=1 Tax=Halocaridina rubra TaxID=373956 RepID=A0AAN8WS95_HALRR